MVCTNTKHCITFIQRRYSIFDIGPALYKYYINVLRLLGCMIVICPPSNSVCIYAHIMNIMCYRDYRNSALCHLNVSADVPWQTALTAHLKSQQLLLLDCNMMPQRWADVAGAPQSV